MALRTRQDTPSRLGALRATPVARRAALALVALAALAGCHPRRPPPDLSGDPAALLEQVRAVQARVARVQGEARVRVKAPGLSGSVRELVAAEKPDRVRLETLDFFGNPAAVLVTEGGRFALYDARERVFYRGAATPENLARLLPVAVSPEELVTILCGSAPIGAGAPSDVSVERDTAVLELREGQRTQRLWVGAGAAVLRSEVRDPAPGARAAYDVRFEEHREWTRGRFPWELAVEAKAKGVRLDVRWTDLEVNGSQDLSLFRLEPPRGARIVDLAEAPFPPSIFQGEPDAPSQEPAREPAGEAPRATPGG